MRMEVPRPGSLDTAICPPNCPMRARMFGQAVTAGRGRRAGGEAPAIVVDPYLQGLRRHFKAQGGLGGLRMFDDIVDGLPDHQKKMMPDFGRPKQRRAPAP